MYTGYILIYSVARSINRTLPRRTFPRPDTSPTDTSPTDTSPTDTSPTDTSPTDKDIAAKNEGSVLLQAMSYNITLNV